MKNILLYLWQLPQNLLGLFVIAFTGVQPCKALDITYYRPKRGRFGVSLGNYIILSYPYNNLKTVQHEHGHQRQSLYLGWLYLIVIGLPSASGNLWDRAFHKHWNVTDREKWYYSLPWEAWADRLGGVTRNV